MNAVLDVRGLRYELQGRTLVDDVSFAVGAGETLVLLGRSGAGKTTTLRLINRLITPSAGDVRIAGDDSATQDDSRLRRRIGYVIQEIGLFPHFTVAENVGLVPRLERWSTTRAEQLEYDQRRLGSARAEFLKPQFDGPTSFRPAVPIALSRKPFVVGLAKQQASPQTIAPESIDSR